MIATAIAERISTPIARPRVRGSMANIVVEAVINMARSLVPPAWIIALSRLKPLARNWLI
ncbi:MAG: hypothetical protein DDT29_02165 [Dehalococcoidia bacterium]|nr:hypothetical protein [Bacillota bacterium]